MEELINDIYNSLEIELQITDANYNSSLCLVKVKNATNEVRNARNYPSTYTEDMIVADLKKFFSVIRDVALYDYNTVGAEFETSHNENSLRREWVSRDKLFFGVIPIAR